jgi:hypothetical protein
MKRALSLAAACAWLALLASGPARAQSQAQPAQPDGRPQAQEERAGGAARPPRKAASPAGRPAPPPAGPRQAARRRSVQQIIATVPTAAPSYGPTLYPRPPAPSGATGLPPVYPPPPAQINNCSGAVCTDAAGNTYGAGIGNAAVNGQGRLCNRVGTTIQCF